ncbi:MAG: PEP-CTERM sorting domain-containing protein, partial [Acetobacteraceae bacterium]
SVTLTSGDSRVVINRVGRLVVWQTNPDFDNVFLLNHYLRAPGDSRERDLYAFFGNTAPDAEVFRDRAVLSWQSAVLRAVVEIDLRGGAPGQGRSVLSRRLTLTNLGRDALDLVVFDYQDFDVVFDQRNQVDRTRLAAPGVLEARNLRRGDRAILSRVSPEPEGWEIAPFLDLYFKLLVDRDGPTTLGNAPGVGVWLPAEGGGDQGAAFSWSVSLQPGGRAVFVNLAERIVPEPATLALFGVGLAGLAALRPGTRRRCRLPPDHPSQKPAPGSAR